MRGPCGPHRVDACPPSADRSADLHGLRACESVRERTTGRAVPSVTTGASRPEGSWSKWTVPAWIAVLACRPFTSLAITSRSSSSRVSRLSIMIKQSSRIPRMSGCLSVMAAAVMSACGGGTGVISTDDLLNASTSGQTDLTSALGSGGAPTMQIAGSKRVPCRSQHLGADAEDTSACRYEATLGIAFPRPRKTGRPAIQRLARAGR